MHKRAEGDIFSALDRSSGDPGEITSAFTVLQRDNFKYVYGLISNIIIVIMNNVHISFHVIERASSCVDLLSVLYRHNTQY
jgi:hypothetical protein